MHICRCRILLYPKYAAVAVAVAMVMLYLTSTQLGSAYAHKCHAPDQCWEGIFGNGAAAVLSCCFAVYRQK